MLIGIVPMSSCCVDREIEGMVVGITSSSRYFPLIAVGRRDVLCVQLIHEKYKKKSVPSLLNIYYSM